MGLKLRLVALENIRTYKNTTKHFSLDSQLLLQKTLLWSLQPSMSEHLATCIERISLKWEDDPNISDITMNPLVQFRIHRGGKQFRRVIL